MKKIYYLLLGILVVLSSSCSKQDWDEESKLSIQIQSDVINQILVNDNYFSTTQANLEISSIVISGKRIQSDDVLIDYSKTVQLDFMNPSNVNHAINIPVGTYEELKATINFTIDSDLSYISGDVFSNNSQNEPQTLKIAVSFDEIKNISIFGEQDEDVVLIDNQSLKLNIFLNLQESFENIDESLWNVLMNANQNQSEVNLNSVVGAEFKSSINAEIKNNIKLNIVK